MGWSFACLTFFMEASRLLRYIPHRVQAPGYHKSITLDFLNFLSWHPILAILVQTGCDPSALFLPQGLFAQNT